MSKLILTTLQEVDLQVNKTPLGDPQYHGNIKYKGSKPQISFYCAEYALTGRGCRRLKDYNPKFTDKIHNTIGYVQMS